MYNFISTFDKLNKLNEEVDSKKLIDTAEAEIVENEVSAEESVMEEEIRQLICECDKCGALVIKSEADIVADDETSLVNVEDGCQFCEEAKGFKIIGVIIPYEATAKE